MKSNWMAIGAAWAFLAVLLGAFGAHALELSVEASAWWETASSYHLVHAVALFALGCAFGVPDTQRPPRVGGAAPWLLFVGSVIFSGTLYAMALGAPRFLGAVTPLGGLGMLAGWALLAFTALRRGPQS